MMTIFKKEMLLYVSMPLGTVYVAMFYFFSGLFFSFVLQAQVNQIELLFAGLFNILLFTIPLVTMRLWSEEKKQRTDQLLLVSPISLSAIVWGKFFAALLLYLIAISMTGVFFVLLSLFSTPLWQTFFGNFLGILLLGMALLSIGLFLSSLTEHQMMAAMGSFAVMFLIFMFDGIAEVMPWEWLSRALLSLSFERRYRVFTFGIIKLEHVVFFLSVCVLFNVLSIRMLEQKRFS